MNLSVNGLALGDWRHTNILVVRRGEMGLWHPPSLLGVFSCGPGQSVGGLLFPKAVAENILGGTIVGSGQKCKTVSVSRFYWAQIPPWLKLIIKKGRFSVTFNAYLHYGLPKISVFSFLRSKIFIWSVLRENRKEGRIDRFSFKADFPYFVL